MLHGSSQLQSGVDVTNHVGEAVTGCGGRFVYLSDARWIAVRGVGQLPSRVEVNTSCFEAAAGPGCSVINTCR